MRLCSECQLAESHFSLSWVQRSLNESDFLVFLSLQKYTTVPFLFSFFPCFLLLLFFLSSSSGRSSWAKQVSGLPHDCRCQDWSARHIKEIKDSEINSYAQMKNGVINEELNSKLNRRQCNYGGECWSITLARSLWDAAASYNNMRLIPSISRGAASRCVCVCVCNRWLLIVKDFQDPEIKMWPPDRPWAIVLFRH